MEAARKALEMAQVDPEDLDLVLMCTSTPEDLFGSAPQVLYDCMYSHCVHFVLSHLDLSRLSMIPSSFLLSHREDYKFNWGRSLCLGVTIERSQLTQALIVLGLTFC